MDAEGKHQALFGECECDACGPADYDPDRDRMTAMVAGPTLGALMWWGLIALLAALLGGCIPRSWQEPPNRLGHYAEADVLFTTPGEVDRLCRLGPAPTPAGKVYRGCYVPALRLAVVPHGDPENLAHELRHAREGHFHP